MRISGATYYLNYYKKKSIHAKPKRVLFNFLIVGLFTLELLFEFLVMELQQRNKTTVKIPLPPASKFLGIWILKVDLILNNPRVKSIKSPFYQDSCFLICCSYPSYHNLKYMPLQLLSLKVSVFDPKLLLLLWMHLYLIAWVICAFFVCSVFKNGGPTSPYFLFCFLTLSLSLYEILWAAAN